MVTPEETASDIAKPLMRYLAPQTTDRLAEKIASAIREAVQAEREACAALAEEIGREYGWNANPHEIAQRIRERGSK